MSISNGQRGKRKNSEETPPRCVEGGVFSVLLTEGPYIVKMCRFFGAVAESSKHLIGATAQQGPKVNDSAACVKGDR